MSNTVRKIAGVGAIALGVFISVISGGVGTPLGIKVALIGASLLSGAKKPKVGSVSSSFGSELQLSGDPNAPRVIIYGEAWTAGDLRFRQSTGVDNKDLYFLIVLAGHSCDSVTAVEADREELTLDGSGNVTAPAKWVGLMNVTFHLGSDTQTADSSLTTAFSSYWTSNHRLRGDTYAVVKMTFDETNLSSPPQFRFKVKGRKVYDSRLDSTNGGADVGGHLHHRLNDETTWEWSENCELCKNDFLRGVMINGICIAGLQLGRSRFDWANIAAEANVCDENVSLAAGGNEKRYTANGIIDPRQAPIEILSQFDTAMAGDTMPSDGKWRSYAGAYRTPTLSLTDEHFVGPLRHTPWKGESERFDTVAGQYASQAESGGTIDYAPISITGAVVGSERTLALSFQLVNDVTNTPGTYDGGARAQRIAKLLLEKNAAGKAITVTTNLYGWRCVPGETVNITHAAFGLSAQAMRVMDVSPKVIQDDRGHSSIVVDLTLEAGPSSLYTWSAAETAIDASPALPQAQVPFPQNGRAWDIDTEGKPAGFRGVNGIADRSQVRFASGVHALAIDSSPVTTAAYGLPAKPVDAGQDYEITVEYFSSVASADGFYVRMEEYNSTLPAGKTHVGTFGVAAEAVVQERTSVVSLVNDGPMPGTSSVTETYTYTPTAGTKVATLAFYNYNPATAGVTLGVKWAEWVLKGTKIDLLRGTGPPSDTADLNQNAATDTGSATAASTTITQVQHTPEGQAFNTTVVSVTYSDPPIDCDVLVRVSGYATYFFEATGGLSLDLQYSLQEDSSYADEQHWYIQTPDGDKVYNANISHQRIFSVTAGVSKTFKFMCAKFQNDDIVTIENCLLTYEAIKR